MSSSSLADLSLPEPIQTLISLPSLANIPSCLKSQHIWYPSRFTLRKDGVSFDKPPCNRQGKPATRWQNPSNWMSFDEAVGINLDGVGIMLHEELRLLVSDFDHCVQNGVIIDPWVAQKVKELNSYTECSVSGTGIHVLVWGRLPWKKCKSVGGKIEMYDGAGSRFMMMTGSRIPGTPTEIRDAQDTIDALHLEVFGPVSVETTPQQNQQLNPKGNTSFYREEEERGKTKKEGAQRFEFQPASELTPDTQVWIDNLLDKPRFASTWAGERETSPWLFPSGRYTSSEYELSIASFLAWAGANEQTIMDVICVWRRKHGLKDPVNYSRYSCMIGKAISTVTPRSKGPGYTRKEPKGLYRHGYTRDQILGSIIDAPRTPKQIAEVTGIDPANVKVVLGRLRKDGKVIRDRHTYLCAPHAVPAHLQNIPEDAGELTGEELAAEYEAWVAAGGLDSVEESIEAPLLAPLASVAVIKATMPDFDDYVEPEPELLLVASAPSVVGARFDTPPVVEGKEDPFSSRAIAGYRAATVAWEIEWKKENRARLREARKRPNYHSLAELKREAKAKKRGRGYARLPSQLDPDGDRLRELEALRRPDEEDPA